MKNIKIKLIKPSTQKLQFVKLIKECSGLGLKEAKDLCDKLHSFPGQSQVMPIRDWETKDWSTGTTTPTKTDWIKKFIIEIKDIDGQFNVTGDKEWIRDIKLLQIGMGDEEDYRFRIKEYITDGFDNSDILDKVLSKLNKEDLISVISQINL